MMKDLAILTEKYRCCDSNDLGRAVMAEDGQRGVLIAFEWGIAAIQLSPIRVRTLSAARVRLTDSGEAALSLKEQNDSGALAQAAQVIESESINLVGSTSILNRETGNSLHQIDVK